MLLEGQLFGIVMRVDSDTIPYVHGDLSNTPRCAESPRRYEWRNVIREACSLQLYPLCLNVCI